ncbi:MAG TPA: KTSC domain-containing protein [Candidatus Thermoplasmatota archaeon]|nr:KTSC domain-containing protein [Candidatus Thermoplasmatota archaeon]
MDLPEAWTKAPARTLPPEVQALPALELPRSKALARLRYDPSTRNLIAEFRNGGIYRYFGVSQEDYEKLAASPSPGARFNENIQPYHEFEEL